jgi:OOP family OmpA-OmpF porin
MKSRNPLLALIFIVVFASGCASNPQISKPVCILAGAVVGGGAGALADHGEQESVAIGAVAGGVLAWLFCDAEQDEDGDGVVDSKDRCRGTPSGTEVDSSGCPVDSDGDGVTDSQDKCPDTPRGTRVNNQGCPLDSDGDGVTDDKDRCPSTPRGATVNANGCHDSDGDGVYDNNDKCPGTPSGQAVNAKGCHIVFSLKGVHFAFNSAQLGQEADAELDRAVKMLKQNSGINVEVQGHTDSSGAEDYNQQLSQRRAQSVVDYLVRNGISSSRLTARGYGEGSPTASNETKEGRARNRRVDFVLDK